MATVFDFEGVEIEDTFAEMFPMWAGRLLITADSEKWARTAAAAATGFATSIMYSPAEAGVEGVPPERTPDGRIGALVQIWHRTRLELKGQMIVRIGQCILTCPTTAVFDALPDAKRRLKVGRSTRLFGDGFQEAHEIAGRKAWRIPVMEGEFVIEDTFGAKLGVAGGNFLIMSESRAAGLEAAEKATEAIGRVEGVVLTFPGGICRSGSKVGSMKYKLLGSTNHPFCPTLRGVIPRETMVPEGVSSVYEIVINGLSLDMVNRAMREGIKAATKIPGVKRITAVNFGGKLGKYKTQLRDILS